MDYVNKARRIVEEKTAASLYGAGQLSLQNQEIYSVIADARIREVRGSMEQARPEPKILHFSDGTLSVDELLDSEGETETETAPPVDARTLDWLPWMWYQTLNAGATALKGADFLGEKLANFFGITSPKYQLEIEERLAEIVEENEEKIQMQQDIENWAGMRPISDQRISQRLVEDHSIHRLDAGDLPQNYSGELSVFSSQPVSQKEGPSLPIPSLHV